MELGVNSLLMCLFVGLLSHSQGLQFTLDSTPDTFYCGQLHCSIDVNQNDTRIFSVVGLSISSIVQSNTLIKLASIYAFDPVPHVEPTKVHDLNVTGSVTRYHANLDLSLNNKSDCVTSFLCELDFTNVSGQSDNIREVVTPVDTTNCDDVDRRLTNIDGKLTDVDSKLAELGSQNTATKQELAGLETKLDSVLGYLTRLEALINTSQHSENTFSCVRGAPHYETREKFLLWGRVPALCDTETDGGGWVIIQRRTKGNVDFYRRWSHYKNGFGNLQNDYWIGNDNIHQMTKRGYTTLRVDMESRNVQYYAEYSNFRVAGKSSKYQLTVSGYHGNTYDAFSQQNDMYFSTYDNNNDKYPGVNCAAADQYHGGWWYKACTFSNLNGMWGARDYRGMSWYGIIMPGSVTWSEMKIRHR